MNLPVELQKNEKVLSITRRHIVFMFLKLSRSILFGFVPAIVLLVLALGSDGNLGSILGALAVIWFLGALLHAGLVYYRYQNDIWIITNQRLIDSTKFTPFNQRVSSADLINVEDMTVEKQGVLPTMFNYGDLRCQTAGAHSNFVLAGIPDPTKTLQLVDEQRDAARRDLGYRPDRYSQ